MENTRSGRRPVIWRRFGAIFLWGGILLLTLAVSPASAISPASASGHAEDIGQRWCDAWNSHSVDQVIAVFTSDVFYEDVPFGLKVHGAAELRDFAQFFLTAVPDLHLDCTATALHGGQGDIEWTLTGTDVGIFKTRKSFSVRGTSIIDVHGRKISRNSDYYDLATIMRQVGVLPPS